MKIGDAVHVGTIQGGNLHATRPQPTASETAEMPGDSVQFQGAGAETAPAATASAPAPATLPAPAAPAAAPAARPSVPVTLSMEMEATPVADTSLAQAASFAREQAYSVMDRFIAARDQVTGLLPLHVRTEGNQLVATDHAASGLDMGRQTSGLVMTAALARAQGDPDRAARYLEAAETNYAQGKALLADGDHFVHMRDFNDDGTVKSTTMGEPGKSAAGQDDMSRVNPRGYAFRGAADLFMATGRPEYKADLQRYFDAWVRDFHDPQGGFFIHGSVTHNGDHTERSSFNDMGGVKSAYDGSTGAKGNDGTIYALSGVLLPANQALATPQTQALVKEQMDLILDRFHHQNGMLWENYTNDFRPVSQDWQSQPRASVNGQPGPTSHVAIGGHTAMAAQQIIEGARQLRSQGAISQGQYQSYIDRTVALFQDFAANSGAVDWNSGAVHNAIRVEEPEQGKRWIQEWGDASWQQSELVQSLLRLKEEGRLQDIRGPEGKTGQDLLRLAGEHYEKTYALKNDYAFDGFGNPDVYHVPQMASYYQEALATTK